ncbi:MAG: hypothetical protein D6756_01205 [Cyanobacteria bacterium J083]|nr:MAG: hypothetical protein D6756_01205 [Cyanobacteria bacterium J083]
MYTIDLILYQVPVPISVHRQESEAANALYNEILKAMQADKPQLLELTCDKDKDKKIAVFSDRISVISLSKKSGAAASGRSPGFFSVATTE